MPKCWIGDSRINHEKIIIKKKNTTSPNVKEKLKKDGEKEKQERERQERSSWETTCVAKVALGVELLYEKAFRDLGSGFLTEIKY